jgi:uncharacterized protein YkwD
MPRFGVFSRVLFQLAALACGALATGPAASARLDRGRPFETAVLAEINFVRARPADYAERLRNNEPTPATLEAIAALQQRRPAPPLAVSPGLAASAAEHAADEGANGAFEHTGSDGSSAGERMHRHGVWAGVLAEEMSAGEETPQDVVRQLIVDEDVPGRGHRNDLLDPYLKRAGVACAPHRVYRVICVIDLAAAAPAGD